MRSMHAFVLANVLFWAGLCATDPCDAAGTLDVKDCFNASDLAAATACRMQVWATYQAIQVAQAKHGMTTKTCQFGVNVTGDKLVDLLRKDIRALPVGVSRSIVAETIALLSPPVDCTLGVATDVGGLAAGSLLNICMQGIKPGGNADTCWAYVAAMRDSLGELSAYKAEKFFCEPNENISTKDAILLLADEIKRDIKAQQVRPAAEVMAEALSRRYPCNSGNTTEDFAAIASRALEIIEHDAGKVTALVPPANADSNLAAALKTLRPVVVRASVPKSKTRTLPKGYLIVVGLKITGKDAEFESVLGPGALAGTLGADEDCGLHYSIGFSQSNGKWQVGTGKIQQCTP